MKQRGIIVSASLMLATMAAPAFAVDCRDHSWVTCCRMLRQGDTAEPQWGRCIAHDIETGGFTECCRSEVQPTPVPCVTDRPDPTPTPDCREGKGPCYTTARKAYLAEMGALRFAYRQERARLAAAFAAQARACKATCWLSPWSH